nr:uncharacterized protein LOC104087974 [Nicotiana tomentosiformis]
MAFEIGGDGALRYQGRLCVPNVAGLQEKIMIKIHQYSIHPGSTKMYHDVKEQYWWDNMKKSITEFVAQCPNCQQKGLGTQVNLNTAFHLQTDGQAEHTIPVLKWPRTRHYTGGDVDHQLDGSKSTSTELYGLYLIHQAIEKVKVIQEQLRMAQSRQKYYSDVRRRDLEFEVHIVNLTLSAQPQAKGKVKAKAPTKGKTSSSALPLKKRNRGEATSSSQNAGRQEV